MATKDGITALIATAGDGIRTLKEASAPADQITAKVAELKTHKVAYKELTGEDFDPPPLSKKEQKELAKKKKAEAAAAAAAVCGKAGDAGLTSAPASSTSAAGNDAKGAAAPSKNELKKLAKAAKKDAKRESHKDEGVAPCDQDVNNPPPTPPSAAAVKTAAAEAQQPNPTRATATYAELIVETVSTKLEGSLGRATMLPRLSEPNTIARYLVSVASEEGSTAAQLLAGEGKGQQQQRKEEAEVAAWMSLAAKVDHHTSSSFRFAEAVTAKQLAPALKRSKAKFLVGGRLTLADVAMALALAVAGGGAHANFLKAEQMDDEEVVKGWMSAVDGWLSLATSSSPSGPPSSHGSNGTGGGALLCAVGSVPLPRKRLARLTHGSPLSPPFSSSSSAAGVVGGGDGGGGSGEGGGVVAGGGGGGGCGGGGDAEKAAKQAAAKAAKEAKKASKKVKNDMAPGEASSAEGAAEALACCKLDFRCGLITRAWEHPESDKLWVEEIEVGEAKPRQICSGLRAFYATADEVCPRGGRAVVVVANLKTKKLGGLPSEGMVLCAASPAHDVVKFVDPPAGAKPGDRVTFQGLPIVEPATAAQIMKKKVAEAVIFGRQLTTAASLNGSSGGAVTTCTFQGVHAMVVEGIGECTAPVPAGFVVA